MIKATALFTHALNMLFHAPSTTLRVILPAVLWVMGAAAAAGLLAGDALGAMDQVIENAAPPPAGQLLILIACGLAGILGYALMAILWHRYVLLDHDRSACARAWGCSGPMSGGPSFWASCSFSRPFPSALPCYFWAG